MKPPKLMRSVHCGGLFRDDDATAAAAAEGLVRWCICRKVRRMQAVVEYWNIETRSDLRGQSQ
jgi:hypothetical protein